MHADTETDDYRRRFREMELAGLLEAWEESMPDAVRALLRSELEARRYRIQSLPEPPLPPKVGDKRPLAVTPLTREEHAREQVGLGVFWILVVAVLQILGGLYSLGYVFTQELEGATGSARVVLASVPLALGVVFLLIYRRARRSPRNGLVLALALFVGVHGLLALLDPEQLLHGAAIKTLVLMAFVTGLRKATELERLAPEKS